MWVARDKDGILFLYKHKPIRKSCEWYYMGNIPILLDKNLFPNLKWEDDPIEIVLLNKEEFQEKCGACQQWVDFTKGKVV